MVDMDGAGPPSSFGYSFILSIVNNFESNRSLILGVKLNPNKWVNPKIYSVQPTVSVYNKRTLLEVIGMIGSLFGKDSN